MTTKEQLITRISDRRRKAISVEEIMLLDDIVSWVQAREAKIAELQMRPEDAQPPGPQPRVERRHESVTCPAGITSSLTAELDSLARAG